MTRIRTAIAFAALATTVACAEEQAASGAADADETRATMSVSPAAAAALAALSGELTADEPAVEPVDLPEVDCHDPVDGAQAGICGTVQTLERATTTLCPIVPDGVAVTPALEEILKACQTWEGGDNRPESAVFYRSVAGTDVDPTQLGCEEEPFSIVDLYPVLVGLMMDEDSGLQLEVAVQPTTGIIEEIAMYDRQAGGWHVIEVATDLGTCD